MGFLSVPCCGKVSRPSNSADGGSQLPFLTEDLRPLSWRGRGIRAEGIIPEVRVHHDAILVLKNRRNPRNPPKTHGIRQPGSPRTGPSPKRSRSLGAPANQRTVSWPGKQSLRRRPNSVGVPGSMAASVRPVVSKTDNSLDDSDRLTRGRNRRADRKSGRWLSLL
jgi:hypothetical protein